MNKNTHTIPKPVLILVPLISLTIMVFLVVSVYKHRKAVEEYNTYRDVDLLVKKNPENIQSITQDGDTLIITTKPYAFLEGHGTVFKVKINKLWDPKTVWEYAQSLKKIPENSKTFKNP